MSIRELTGGTSPASAGDPRTFPAIWNGELLPELGGKVDGFGVDGIAVVDEGDYPGTPEAGVLYVVFPDP